MDQIKAVCLGHEETFIDNYQSIDKLIEVVSSRFNNYFNKKNAKVASSQYILTYEDETSRNEELLKDLKVIKRKKNQWFYLSVKKIWNACCTCISPFGVLVNQLPYECPQKKCGYQYCRNCIEAIKRCNSQNNAQFYCIYCANLSLEGPRENTFLTDLLWEQFYQKYGVDLLSELNVMPGTLKNDLSCRIVHLQCLVKTLSGKKQRNVSHVGPIADAISRANKLIDVLKGIKLQVNDETFNDYLVGYINHLNGSIDSTRKCQEFIVICELLLHYIEQVDFENHFPFLNQIMTSWQAQLINTPEFKPKIIDAFKAMEKDLGELIYPMISLRIGLIGETSAGKSSLLNRLRGLHDDEENFKSDTALKKELMSPMRHGKSTLCRLEFEHQGSDGSKITLVDIEGATNYDRCLKSGNYLDEIRKADCDLYIIVFEHQCTEIHRSWEKYIINELGRQCWFVRSKVDDLFLRTFQEDVGVDFNSANQTRRDNYAKLVLDRIRKKVTHDICGQQLSKLYLTSCSYNRNSFNEILFSMPYGKFDLDELIHDIEHLPLNLHESRLLITATHATARVINTCFRRGYVVNVLKYKIYAGVAAVVPLLDLLPRYYGREDIRQAFGVNSRSRFKNWLTGRTDEFKDYLTQFQIEITPEGFTTSAFEKSFRYRGTATTSKVSTGTSVVVKGVTTVGVTGLSVTDDVLRAAGVGAITAVRGASISFIVVGGVFTAAMCAWSAVSAGKQMYNYLNRLCDDLIVVTQHVAKKIIEDNRQTRTTFSN